MDCKTGMRTPTPATGTNSFASPKVLKVVETHRRMSSINRLRFSFDLKCRMKSGMDWELSVCKGSEGEGDQVMKGMKEEICLGCSCAGGDAYASAKWIVASLTSAQRIPLTLVNVNASQRTVQLPSSLAVWNQLKSVGIRADIRRKWTFARRSHLADNSGGSCFRPA